MKTTVLAEVKVAVNTLVHAAVAYLAVHIPADIFNIDDDRVAIIGAATAGIVAAAHQIGHVLEKLESNR